MRWANAAPLYGGSAGLNPFSHIYLLAVQLLLDFWLFLLERNAIYSMSHQISCKFMQIELTFIFFQCPIIRCMHSILYIHVQIYIPSPTYTWTYTYIQSCLHAHLHNVCTNKVFIKPSPLLSSCWKPIKQRMERVKCLYVNVCKWGALLLCQSHWAVTGIFSTAVAAGRKPLCHGPQAPCPLKLNP